jgi:hypothetical protein
VPVALQRLSACRLAPLSWGHWRHGCGLACSHATKLRQVRNQHGFELSIEFLDALGDALFPACRNLRCQPLAPLDDLSGRTLPRLDARLDKRGLQSAFLSAAFRESDPPDPFLILPILKPDVSQVGDLTDHRNQILMPFW